jgi:hypothetical protein
MKNILLVYRIFLLTRLKEQKKRINHSICILCFLLLFNFPLTTEIITINSKAQDNTSITPIISEVKHIKSGPLDELNDSK